jgi:hypothetical protein
MRIGAKMKNRKVMQIESMKATSCPDTEEMFMLNFLLSLARFLFSTYKLTHNFHGNFLLLLLLLSLGNLQKKTSE